jgi:hypothetical protein
MTSPHQAPELQIALTPQFQEAQHKLSDRQQRNVNAALLKLQRGQAAVHLHKLQGSSFVTFGVNQEALRIVCQREDGLLILLYVGSHDAAYQWAGRHRVVQVGSVVRILQTVVEDGPAPAPVGGDSAVDQPCVAVPPGPLARVADARFQELEIAARAAAVLRAVPDDDTLTELAICCRPELGDALLSLAVDPERWDEILAAYRAPRRAPKLADAIGDIRNSSYFRHLPPGEEQLAAALDAGNLRWRLFLHPTQRRLVERRSSGALSVTGGPGTGKTVVALHRVRFLLERVFADDPRPVLLTTFNSTLAAQLREDITALLGAPSTLAQRVVVETTTNVALELLRQSGQPAYLLDTEVTNACWDEAQAQDPAARPRAFYEAEREHVLARWGVWERDAYLAVLRTDRHEVLTRAERVKVWLVLEAFERALAERHGGDRIALAREATQMLRDGRASQPYAAVVCDESQDVGAAELRLLAALTAQPDGAGTRPDALMLLGDGYQRIFSQPVRPAACGIDIRGRSTRLALNYRTTEGIRRAAVAVVEGLGLDELDADAETTAELGDVLASYRSLRPGPLPERVVLASNEAQADWLAGALRSAGGQLLILARTNERLRTLRDLLSARGCEPLLMTGQSGRPPSDVPVVLCTMHRAKGLEAPRVVVMLDGWPAPWPGGGDAGDQALWRRKENCLMYVAISRAREWCALLGTSVRGPLSG